MKKLRVTVAGKVYEVIVEVLEEDEHEPSSIRQQICTPVFHS